MSNKWRDLMHLLSPIIVSVVYDSTLNKVSYNVQKEIDCEFYIEQGYDLTACLRRIEKKCKEKGYEMGKFDNSYRYI